MKKSLVITIILLSIPYQKTEAFDFYNYFLSFFQQSPVNEVTLPDNTPIENTNKNTNNPPIQNNQNNSANEIQPAFNFVPNESIFNNSNNSLNKILSEISKPSDNNIIIKDAQKILNVTADGIIGKKTTQAIKEFQKNNNLKQTGNLDEITLTRLDEINDACSTFGSIEGDKKNILGCGKSSVFGHTITGEKDPYHKSGGNDTYCRNNRAENIDKIKNRKDKDGYGDEQYLFRTDRPKEENLKTCVVALRIKDVRKIFNLPTQDLRKNRQLFCGQMIKIKNLENGKEVHAPLYDLMNNDVDKVIDLTGCVAKKIMNNDSKEEQPNFKVQIEWSKQTTPEKYLYTQ